MKQNDRMAHRHVQILGTMATQESKNAVCKRTNRMTETWKRTTPIALAGTDGHSQERKKKMSVSGRTEWQKQEREQQQLRSLELLD